MEATIMSTLVIVLAFYMQHCTSLNIETQEPKMIGLAGEESFGHRVETIKFKENWIVVSAPLAKNRVGVRTGQIYRCLFSNGSCWALDVPPPANSTPTSLGLSLSVSQTNVLACGPNLAHRCGLNMYLNGVCFLFDQRFRVIGRFPPKIQDCFTAQVDLAFLIDGSGSINPKDFLRMKDFLNAMLRRFRDRDVQFAVMQFSHIIKKEFSFYDYKMTNKKEDLVERFTQIKGDTYTPTAIKRAVQDLFGPSGGSRLESSRALIIVTDGQSNDMETSFEEAVEIAEKDKVFRIAVGVGPDFQTAEGMKELSKIASKGDNVFSILNYEALGTIEDKLQNKIFSIEGTKGNSSSFEREIGQEGFSCLLTSDAVVLGSVGAFGWRGGVIAYHGERETFLNLTDDDSKDSYLGYSLQTAKRSGNIYYISGAPRHHHRGEVVVFRTRSRSDSWDVVQRIPGDQIGANFGAEISVLDLTGDGTSDILLIAAPMFSAEDREGRVFVFRMTDEGVFSATTTLSGSPLRGRARFGSAVAPLGDLDGDGLSDVAVGAPLEEGGRGAVYIFSGTPSSIRKHHSLRLSGSTVSTSLRYFGRSVSGSRDVSGDGLVDLVVGSKGAVLVFRSRPVLKVVTSFTFDPPQVPPTVYPCPRLPSPPHPISSTFCINLTWARNVPPSLGEPHVNISCTLRLDSHLPNSRATFQTSRDRLDEDFHVSGTRGCLPFQIYVSNCIENYLNPILVQIDLRIIPKVIENSDGLVPIIDQKFNTSQFGEIYFERECILGKNCPDYLIVTFNFSGGDVLVIGTQEVLRVGVCVENRGDDALKVQLEFHFPPTLTFKRIVADQATIFPVDCEPDVGRTSQAAILTCRLNQLIFHKGSQLKFRADFDAEIRPTEEHIVNLTIKCTSQTPHRITNSSIFTRSLSILHAVDLSIAQSNFTRHVTFTVGQEERHFVTHSYLVTNWGENSVPISVTILIFAGSKNAPLWNVTVTQRDTDTKNYRTRFQTGHLQNSTRKFRNSDLRPDCGIALCIEVTFSVEASRPGTPLVFEVEGEVMEAAVREGKWIHLWSIAEINFDEQRYTDLSPNSAQFRKAMTVTDVEFLHHVSRLPWILGGSFAGLLLLCISVFALYKCGFFKRTQAQDMTESETE